MIKGTLVDFLLTSKEFKAQKLAALEDLDESMPEVPFRLREQEAESRVVRDIIKDLVRYL